MTYGVTIRSNETLALTPAFASQGEGAVPVAEKGSPLSDSA